LHSEYSEKMEMLLFNERHATSDTEVKEIMKGAFNTYSNLIQ
jgi:hypothetical protein